MLVSEKTQKIKFAFLPKQNPNASQWNIGCIGSLALGLCVGHVHFIFFVLISFASGTQRKLVFQWNMGIRLDLHASPGEKEVVTQCSKLILFCVPLGCTHFQPVRPPICLCTPLVYSYDKWVKKRAHMFGKRAPGRENVHAWRRVHC